MAHQDTIHDILRKLVESVGGTPQMADSKRDLLGKYLTAIGGTPIPGDTFYDLLVKVVRIKGGSPSPGDKQWDLLVKWLKAEGECRACGDSLHNLWRKILAFTLGCGEQPNTASLSQVSPGGPFNWAAAPLVNGVIYSIYRSINGGPFVEIAVEDGLNFPFEGGDVGVANGDVVQGAVARQGTDFDCGVTTNTVIAVF